MRAFQMKDTSWRMFLQFAVVFGIISGLSGGIHAQTDQTPQRGFHPAGSYALTDIETINTNNGNLMLRLPLASLPSGRGGSLSASVGLFYNSKIWDSQTFIWKDPLFNTYTDHLLRHSPEGGWRYGFEYKPQLIDRLDQYDESSKPTCGAEVVSRYKLQVSFPDGSSHEFRPSGHTDSLGDGYFAIRPDGWTTGCSGDNPPVSASPMTYYSIDGTYLRLEFAHDGDIAWTNNAWTLYFPDGGRVTSGNALQRIYDRNNNYLEIQNTTYGSNPATRIVDQLSREIIVEYAGDQDYIRQWGFNGQQLQWTVKWKTIPIFKAYYPGEGGMQYLAWTLRVVDQIIMPAQAGALSYTFSYNSGPIANQGNPSYGWGEVSSIILPSGAQASYQYEYDGDDFLSWSQPLENYATRKELAYQREYDGSSTPVTETWLYPSHPSAGFTIIEPDGGVLRESHDQKGHSLMTEKLDGSVIERIWLENIPAGDAIPADMDVNPFVKTEFISIRNSSGALVKTAIKDYTYDKNGNVMQVAEYDWVDYGSVPRVGGRPTGIPGGAPLKRVSVNTYYNPTPDALNTTTDDLDVYHKPNSPAIKRAIESTEARSDFSAGSALSRAESFYDNPSTTGNLIEQRSWDSIKGAITNPLTPANSISVTHQYDSFGNRTHTTDANNVTTAYIYGPINGSSGPDNLYVTETKLAAGTPVQRWARQTYDFNTGLVTQSVDRDNNVTDEMTYDALGRPTIAKKAVGTATERWTRTEYNDQARRLIMRGALNAADDQKLVTVQHYDQLGRIRLSRQLENPDDDVANEALGIKVQSRYYAGDVNNPDPTYRSAYQLVSNPYRAATSTAASMGEDSSTMGWTRTKLDKGGRVIETQTFGADLPQPWGEGSIDTGVVITEYDGESTKVTDQAGKKRSAVTDALGRLINVTEAPDELNHVTSYSYDALGNLRLVTQGAQTRTFVYDSLSRLTSATNPESGRVEYTYDSNGNLKEKTDARGVKTTMTYDALNRVSSKVYSGTPSGGTDVANATPPVHYFYDNYTGMPSGAPSWLGTPSKGRLTGVTYGPGSEGTYYKYDAAGRVVTNHQRMGTSNYVTTYSYNRAGAVKQEDRGSSARRKNWMAYDTAGRLIAMQTGIYNFSGFPPHDLVRDISYTPFGGLQSETYGNELIHSMAYNDRHQPIEIRLGRSDDLESAFRLGYIYGTANNVDGQDAEITAAHNNGNIARIKYLISGAVQYTQTFKYDQFNRLGYAVEHKNGTYNNAARAWYQTFDCDRYGNCGKDVENTSDNVDGENSALRKADFSEANNRIMRAGFVYDAAGNLIAEPGRIYTYNAENLLISATVDGVLASQYFYDGNGRRVKKIVGGVGTRFEYGAGGELIADWNDADAPNRVVQKDYFYKGGELIATSKVGNSGQYEYATADHLGSPRAWTDDSGALIAGGRHDYLPFGEELLAGVGTRTASQGYAAATQADGQRKQFGSKERDIETGLDFSEARYYASLQGRFTSTDPIILAPERVIDPQQINLYQYARNNPLRFTDPTGEIIEENIPEEYKKRFAAWKKEYLSTDAGRKQWAKYADDKNFTLTIAVADRGKRQGGNDPNQGAEVDRDSYQWNSNGKLIAATIILGNNINSGYPDPANYPVTSSLQNTDKGYDVSGEVLAATKIAHEFGHVNRTASIDANLYQLQQRLVPEYNKLFFQNRNDPRLAEMARQMGGTPVALGLAGEHWAEANTIPYLRDRYPGGKGMPGRIKKAIEAYQKTYPGR